MLFLVQIGLSVALVAASALSRVALHRLSNGRSWLGFLATLREPASAHRMAAGLLRQLCLLGGAALVVDSAHATGRGTRASLALGAAAVASIVLAEMLVARLLAVRDPRAALRRTAFLLVPSYLVLYPIVRPVQLVLSRIHRPQAPSEEDREDGPQEEDVEALIEVAEREGIFEADESEMMRSIVDLDETVVREIMTPRNDIVALAHSTTVAAARRRILEAGHSRLPVYRDTLDDVVGVLHTRDLLRAWEEGQENRPVAAYVREPMLVPETHSVADLLAVMRVKTHIALIVDEYGGVAGLVTLEDLLEEIVGDIRDEHELVEEPLRQDPDGSWVVDAAVHVEELEDRFGVDLGERDFDTVGGLVVAHAGRVPAPGEKLRIHDLEIEVLRADARRVREVRVRPPAGESDARAGA
jgi:magnesium and cobalt transporter